MKQAIGFLQYSSEYICFSAISESDKEKLLEKGYLASFFPSCVYAIDCKIFNHPHHGIGIRNIKLIYIYLLCSPKKILLFPYCALHPETDLFYQKQKL